LYGYTKLNDKQIHFYIKLYFSFFRLDTVSVVVDEKDDVVALGIAMPSFTKALQKAKGRLFPLGWYYMLRALKKNDLVDLYLMAVHPDYQNKGVNSILFADLMPQFAKNGYKFAESNPELETNTRMSSQWGSFEYVNHKKRRVYIKKFKKFKRIEMLQAIKGIGFFEIIFPVTVFTQSIQLAYLTDLQNN